MDKKELQNPYNINNKPITKKNIFAIFNLIGMTNIPINDLKIYQQSFIHKSYEKKKNKILL